MPGISDFLRLIVESELRGESDAELLGRFVTKREEAAFTAIVRRHGAMVYHVCRGVLRNEADAEDASQATFLVLAQKAARVRKRGSLSSWLHGVALRTSRKLRASIARRRAGEAQLPPPPPASPEDLSVREARMLLHEELERLPARYKDPLVLCYLQGKTHDEAAAELGWTLTVFRGRLERARKQLHHRLCRRGLTLTAGLLAGALAEPSPALATTFAIATARAAALGSLTAASRGLVSPLVAQLTQEVLSAMTLSPVKIAVPLLAAMVLTAGGYVSYYASSALPTAPPQAEAKEAPKAQPDDLRGRILMCKNNRFAKLGPNADFTLVSRKLEGWGSISRHRISPDGKSVIFQHNTLTAQKALSLWKFGQPWPGKVIWSDPDLNDFFWMPDGKQLVLCKQVGHKKGVPIWEFETLDVATRKVAELKVPDGHYLTDVSPDGKWFLTMADPKKKEGDAYRMERSSGEVRKLFEGVIVNLPSDWRISPDGRRVAGMKYVAGRTWPWRLFVGEVKDGTLRQVTGEDHPEQFYGWSPDGRKLLYSFTRGPAQPELRDAFHQIIAAIDADGKNRIELYDCEGHYVGDPLRPGMNAQDMVGWADWR